MKRIVLAISSMLFIVLLGIEIGGSANAASLPQVAYIDEGPGTFNTPLNDFIVKKQPFAFAFEPGPTYITNQPERVWGVSGANGAPPAIWDEEVNLGPVVAGCLARYVGVDDDLDGRRNTFYLNGEQLHMINEGMVFSGSFVIPESGDLILVAEDSVGGWFSPCDETVTLTPTITVTSMPTETPSATGTATPGPSPTATNTPEPTNTATPGPSPTATSTELPPTLQPTATATKRPREFSCVRINFDVGGDDAARGLYIVQESGGKLLASWYALDGWKDSGWFKDIDITHENVYVKVLYYSGPDAVPIEMDILNHAPNSQYGWMSWGVCHAIEVAWPGEKPAGAMVPEEGTPVPSDQPEQGPVSGPEMPAPPPADPAPNEEDQSSPFGATLNS